MNENDYWYDQGQDDDEHKPYRKIGVDIRQDMYGEEIYFQNKKRYEQDKP